jgi:hypothetical protein
MGKGLALTFIRDGNGGFIPEYQDVYDKFTDEGATPNAGDADAQNTFVKQGVTDEWWSDFDRLIVVASHASGVPSLIDWLHPNTVTNQASLVNAPVFTQYQGYKSDGLTSYINLNFIPSVDGVNFLQDDNVGITYTRIAAIGTGNDFEFATNGAGAIGRFGVNVMVSQVSNSGQFYNHSAGITSNGSGTTTGAGMTAIDRSQAARPELYTNGTIKGSTPDRASNGISAETIFGLCYNNSGSPILFSLNQCSVFTFGKSLSAAKHLSFYNAFQALLTHYGTQV